MRPRTPRLELRSVEAGYDERAVLKSFDFTLYDGEIGCLLGPSGCGKTTALRCIAGFEKITSGEILLHGNPVATPRLSVAPEQRRVGLMFQDLALFSHLTVEQNIAFGLQHLARKERQEVVEIYLERLELTSVRARPSRELSGGQQQRVALGRALAPEPEVLLLDEPFSSLDPELRRRLKKEVRDLLKKLGATALFVTHDLHEAYDVADRIALVHEGKVVQVGAPEEIFFNPQTRFVSKFMGQEQFLEGEVLQVDSQGLGEIQTPLATLSGLLPEAVRLPGLKVDVMIRPDQLILDASGPLQGEVIDQVFRGLYRLYTLRVGEQRILQCFAPVHSSHALGSSVRFRIDSPSIVAFPQTGR